MGLLLDGVTSAEEIIRVLEPDDQHTVLKQSEWTVLHANDAVLQGWIEDIIPSYVACI